VNPISLAESISKRLLRRIDRGRTPAIAGPGKPLYILASGVACPVVAVTASGSSEQ
jgi:hypothetical protein